MSDIRALQLVQNLRQRAAEAENQGQWNIRVGFTEARQIAAQIEQLIYENEVLRRDVALLRPLLHDCQTENVQLLGELAQAKGRNQPDARSS